MALFVGLRVPVGVRAVLEPAVAALRARASALGSEDLRWVDPVDWHVTLVYLGGERGGGERGGGERGGGERGGGERGGVQASAVVVGLAELAGASAPFPVSLDGSVGTFGDRVLWAGMAPSVRLAALAQGARAVGAAAGARVDRRPWVGHVTLARSRGAVPVPAGPGSVLASVPGSATLPAAAWTASSLQLLSSAPGQPHADVASWALQG